MSPADRAPSPVVLVTGANGFVGARVCAALVARGASVRALVRRPSTAPTLPGVQEHVGDFCDPGVAAAAVKAAAAVVTTVHPMGADLRTQRRVGVDGTAALARAARGAGVERLVHVSTAAVYDRSPEAGDVDEGSPLVDDDADAYATSKRDADAALAEVDGITRVLLRPPAVLGPGATSIWNTLRPAAIRAEQAARHAVPQRSFPWVHVADLASFAADVALGRVPPAGDPGRGPVPGRCTAVNVAAGPATARDYHAAVTRALGVEPVWEQGPAWTGRVLARRAGTWGWAPTVDLPRALAELERGLRG